MTAFKEESSMVRGLIRDLKQLPPHQWAGVVSIFMQQLHKLALTLLSVIHWNGWVFLLFFISCIKWVLFDAKIIHTMHVCLSVFHQLLKSPRT